MKLSQLLRVACLGLLLGMPAWAAQDGSSPEACPHPKGWQPSKEELQRIISEHRQWSEAWEKMGRAAPEGRANLCSADLRGVELNRAELAFADLNGANLEGARLNEANLHYAELNGADLSNAELNKAKLAFAKLEDARLLEAELHEANLYFAVLYGTNLAEAKLNGANLGMAGLDSANLLKAELNGANVASASLNEATLIGAKLNGADLRGAKLNKANLSGAELKKSNLTQASLASANLDNAELTEAHYAPNSPPPDPYVANIKGLKTTVFPDGDEVGLVQLRDLLQRAGLRELEREATFAIERGKTSYGIASRDPGRVAEAIFRMVAFDFTTRYGLEPVRALFSILVIWVLLIPMYSWSIWRMPRHSKRASGIYRISPKDRIEFHHGTPSLDNSARVERLHARSLAAVGWAAYFSLLSAFQIGFREFSVGNWLTRTQPRNFALEGVGWVRTLSGVQSLLSVYLLAMWLLTYFGRPFQ